MKTTASGNASSPSEILGGTEGVLNKASSGAHTAVDSLANAADDVANKAKPTIDRVATMAHHAVDKAADAAAPTAEWLSEHAESLRDAEKKLVSNTCGYVSANPMKSVGIALLAGFVLSRFVFKFK
jgi:ElaB/YqjD/DUF883 family membrane-anchored ribosome-binding protein